VSALSVEDRKLEVLRAIVEDYISTNEPVGSKGLVDRRAGCPPMPAIGCSSTG
jgi:transcriptional regulator of heat shock response